MTLAPLPLQRPRVPIWVGGESSPALRRAARWDGWVAGGDDENCRMIKSPEQVSDKVAYIQKRRSDTRPFDVALTGCSQPSDGCMIREFAAAGVTWWLESLHGFRGSFNELEARVMAGPAI